MFCQEWEINELGSSPMLNNYLLPSSWCCPTPSHLKQHYLKSRSYSSPCYLKGDLLNIVLRIDLVFFFVSLPSQHPRQATPTHLAPQCKLCKYYIPSLARDTVSSLLQVSTTLSSITSWHLPSAPTSTLFFLPFPKEYNKIMCLFQHIPTHTGPGIP